MQINKIVKFIGGLPCTIYANFKLFPPGLAIKLPIVMASNTRIRCLKGKVKINGPVGFGLIRIGFHESPECESDAHTVLELRKGGLLVFDGDAHIGRGAMIYVGPKGVLQLGQNFAISGSTKIDCEHKICIGNDVQFSWNTLIMDADHHSILNEEGHVTNTDRPVRIGNKVWIGCNCLLLKGTQIGNNCVVGAASVLTGAFDEDNILIAGHPGHKIKTIGGWMIDNLTKQ